MRRLVSFYAAVVAIATLPLDAVGQLTGPPEITIQAPSNGATRHAVNPRIYVEYSMGGACLDPGDGSCAPNPQSLVVRINGGSNLALVPGENPGEAEPAPGWTVEDWYAENGSGAVGVDNFNGTFGDTVSNTLYARICNAYDCAEQTITVYIALDAPAVALDGHSPSVYDLGACAAVPVAPGAAFVCDALVVSHAAPGYVSHDAFRSVAVVYSSRSALAEVTVPFSVSTWWDVGAEKVEAWMTGYSSTYWQGTDWEGSSGTVTRRTVLARPEDTGTGGYIGRTTTTVTARVHGAAGTYDGTAVDTLPFYFERDGLTTEIARGWGIAGLSRIYGESGHAPLSTGPGTSGALVVQGGGGVAYYKYVSSGGDTVVYSRPAGAFATLKGVSSGTKWELLAIDGTAHYYSWVSDVGYARLDSIVTPVGKTTIAYRTSTSGSPATITDPAGKQIRFDYTSGSGVGKLEAICAPAGANERCIDFHYGGSGGNVVVDSIVDPDGQRTVFGYSGGPHWSVITSITPRALGTYTIAYNGQIDRPIGAIQPGSSDTVHYVAPQLAGAGLEGGTSGSPAATAPGDSAWGHVSPPLGPATYFAADRFGNTTWTKDATGKVSRVVRNSDGQPTTTSHEGQNLMHWTYNTVGALTTARLEGGDTTFVTYSGACASGTGYPCLPGLRVAKNTPLPPDTTKWFYGSDQLVDSLYRSSDPLTGQRKSGYGITRYWYGANARVDSVQDWMGHDRAFRYDGTWGNVNWAVGDTIALGCTPTCSTALDTVTLGHDATGRVAWTRRGTAGRKIEVFRDLMARDTMIRDSAQGGGSAITQKTLIDEGARTVTVVDGRDNSITFLHDLRGRRVRRTDAASAQDSVAYDANDRVTTWITRRADTITYSYDALGRLTAKVAGGETTDYGYHATLGTLDTLVNDSTAVYRVHNAFGWLTEEKTVVSGETRVVEFGYTPLGVLDTLTDPWGGTYAFGWDAGTNTRTVTNPFSQTFSLAYDADGRLSQVSFPNDSTDDVTYDRAHLISRAGRSGEIAYARDPVTKGIAGITWGGVTQVFGYDAFGRLAADSVSTTGYGPVSESFSYDAAGNRTGGGGTFTYGATNALGGRPTGLSEPNPGDTLVYDAAGNPVWWKNKGTGWYDSLTWNAEDQLVRLRRYNEGGSLQLDVRYAYDGFGRRLKKWGSGVTDRLYVWNGWELLGETDLDDTPVRRYTHHPDRIDFPLAMWDDLTNYLLHRDGQGNVYLVTSTSGAKQSEYRYRAWGNRHDVMTENVQSPFTYKGAYEDRETGLIYMRHRYYSPRLERFVNEDPIGMRGGLNTFRFARNDPCNAADALGLCPKLTVGPGKRVDMSAKLDFVGATAAQERMIRDGIEFQFSGRIGGYTTTLTTDDPNGPTITITVTENAIGVTIFGEARSFGAGQGGEMFLSIPNDPSRSNLVGHLAAHEFGHVSSLPHDIRNPNNLMYDPRFGRGFGRVISRQQMEAIIANCIELEG